MRCLGEGGMGVVYEAVDEERQSRVALKTLRTLGAESLLRFKREFRALQDLHHPNLVNLGELIEEAGQWFFTMELVDGVDFLTWVRPFERLRLGDEDTTLEMPPLPKVLPETALPTAPGMRPPPLGPDEARLRNALGQLALGLQALHGAGIVHRDIKPSNVLVTKTGRVVLLDFGLATDVTASRAGSDANVVGTADYMAPEQAASRPVGPEADWYAVGIVLFEALTGRVPFTGAPLQILMDKQRREAPAPRSIVPTTPADLDALCFDLLRFDPAARPAGRHVLRRLRVEETRPAPSSSAVLGSPFVGRERELEQLRAAYGRNAALTVLVRGESGLGKSALVRRFVESLAADDRRPVVLTGRCYERESVPYKAFDGLVDELAQYMRELSKAEVAALLPRQIAMLAQVFPVLRRVELIAQAPRAAHEALDPQELRNRVFAALRELLGRLADRQPLVLVIDDLQWADADSLLLLREILHPPEEPQLLLIATMRESTPSPTLPGEVQTLELSRLAEAEARKLAALLAHNASARIDSAAIADEAAGHPLFIDALVRHAATLEDPSERIVLRLEDALWSRVAQLEPDARRLLEVTTIAGKPLPQQIVAEASGIPLGDFARRAGLLRVANLVRTSGARGSDTIEPYHDRVRDAVLTNLSGDDQKIHHERLALALESSARADPEALVVHWLGAGDRPRAGRYAAEAAEQANQALAFDRAARLFRLALELGPPAGVDTWRLQARLGDALVNAGRGAEAAQAFLAAAAGGNAAEALDFQRRAAEQLLISGHIDEGLTTLRTVLASVGMKLQATPARALAQLVFRRLLIRLRGIRFKERDPSQIAANDLTRIDVCWSVGIGLGLTDTLRGQNFNGHNLLLSLRAGEPYRVCRALALEAGYSASSGTRTQKRTARLVAAAKALAQKLDHPHAVGLATVIDGSAAYLQGRWKYACEHIVAGNRMLRDGCAGVAWELDSGELFLSGALFYSGEIVELARRVPLALREAQDRGDLYGQTNLRVGYPNLVWLLRDDPDGATRVAEETLRQWTGRGWHVQHYHGLVAQTHIDLYRGNAAAAHARLTEAWPAIKRALLLHVQLLQIVLLNLRGHTAAAVGRKDEAAKMARGLERINAAHAKAFATTVRAAIAGEQARELLQRAISQLEALDMAMHATVARRALGNLEGGETGRAAITAADHWLRSRGVVRPERLAAVLLPAFDR